MKNVILTIVRYGGLLAVFLILAELVRNAHISAFLPLDAYIGITAIAFTVVGGFVVWRLGSQKSQPSSTPPAQKLTALSARENDVLTFLSHGYSNREIADQLKVSENTVKSHLKNIYGKLGVSNRTQAAAEAQLIQFTNNPITTHSGDD